MNSWLEWMQDRMEAEQRMRWVVGRLMQRGVGSAMEAWAERLRDPNASIVEEVIDVIVESELGEQAKSLFLETLRHAFYQDLLQKVASTWAAVRYEQLVFVA